MEVFLFLHFLSEQLNDHTDEQGISEIRHPEAGMSLEMFCDSFCFY